MNLIQMKNVYLQFDKYNPILNNISYDIKMGDFVVLLGSNGSGKSSLLKLLHQHYSPTSGSIMFIDRPLEKIKSSLLSRDIMVLTQNCDESLFTSLTIFENYLLMKHKNLFKLINKKAELNFLKSYLINYNENLPKKLHSLVSTLSGGEKQALALAFCFLNPPKLLLLDEHTSALDPKTAKQIMEITAKNAAKYNITCIYTTHQLETAIAYGNRILVLRDGKIIMQRDYENKKEVTKEMLAANFY